MKEFDKWWREASKDERRYMPDDDYVAKDGWKAALEWALTQETDLQQTELGAAIRKELKNRKT